MHIHVLSMHPHIQLNKPSEITNNIKSFLHSINPKSNVTPSKIYYLSLVDENPDSEDTMMHISEDLLDNLASECQKKCFWLVMEKHTNT